MIPYLKSSCMIVPPNLFVGHRSCWSDDWIDASLSLKPSTKRFNVDGFALSEAPTTAVVVNQSSHFCTLVGRQREINPPTPVSR